MALTQCMVTAFKKELSLGTHNFAASGGDTFKIALYSSSASLNADTTAYTATGEISGTGYSAGGKTLTNVQPTTSGTTCILTFDDISWTGATFTARGALIYNSSKSNKAVAVLDFGSDKTVTASTFAVDFPVATADAAVLRIV